MTTLPLMPDSVAVTRGALLADPVVSGLVTGVYGETPDDVAVPYVRIVLINQTVVLRERLISADLQYDCIGVGAAAMMTVALEVQRALAQASNYALGNGRITGVSEGGTVFPLPTEDYYDEAAERLVGMSVTATVWIRTEQ